jgi:26S proteasome regulatory subunit N8
VAAVPFEEDERDPSIWFLDHSYLENMAAMYKKVNGASLGVINRGKPHHGHPQSQGWSSGTCATYILPLQHAPAFTEAERCPAAREKVVGWYHTGPRIREADLDISALLGTYCDNPLLVICEVEVRSRGSAHPLMSAACTQSSFQPTRSSMSVLSCCLRNAAQGAGPAHDRLLHH